MAKSADANSTAIERPRDSDDTSVVRGIQLVEELLHAEVGRLRAAGVPVGEDGLRGLYIPEIEADRILGSKQYSDSVAPEYREAEDALATLRDEFERFADSTTARLGRLRVMAGLSPLDIGCILLALASEELPDLERLIAYAQDNVSKRRPRVGLVLRLFDAGGLTARGRGAFAPDAPLRTLRLINLFDEDGQQSTPLLAKSVALDPRIASYLLGHDDLDETLHAHARLSGPDAPSLAAMPAPIAAELRGLADLPATALHPPVVHLSGADEGRISAVAGQLAAGAGLRVLTLAVAAAATDLGFETAIAVAQREAALQHAALLLTGVDQLKPEELMQLRRTCGERPVAPLILPATATAGTWPGVSIDIPPEDFPERAALWTSLLGDAPHITQAEVEDLAGKFELRASAIQAAVQSAFGKARVREPRVPEVTLADLRQAARAQSMPLLNSLARKLQPHYGWGDIVLNEDGHAQLRELCAMIEHRYLVYERWGFGRKLAMGKGVMALFAGPSGTGKTMAADVVAGALGLDLYRIDLSGVVSKYIGETEKNLDSIFAEAESSGAMLFFDEADALFGKRSEVKDAHDRYANIETAYLLQRMEEYSGAVILATNLKMNLDEAFSRRLHFVIDFPVPEEEDRHRIWLATIPSEVPRSDDIDFDFLARQFKITGGNIRNIVLAAAFMSATEDVPLGMSHLIRAMRREYQKLGRMVTGAEFGQYVKLLRD
jgi:hypothetical protein